jgi:hypothetical protein
MRQSSSVSGSYEDKAAIHHLAVTSGQASVSVAHVLNVGGVPVFQQQAMRSAFILLFLGSNRLSYTSCSTLYFATDMPSL